MAKINYFLEKNPIFVLFLEKIPVFVLFLADLKNQPVGSLCVTHILPFCGYFKGQDQTVFNPTSWHMVTYNFL